MSRLLMNLRHVPADEADEVRALLEEHGIPYYETPPNRWGVSMGGIWLSDGDDYVRARELLDAYQAERRERARAEQAERRAAGTHDTFAAILRRKPLQVALYIAIVAVLLYFSIRPFFGFGG